MESELPKIVQEKLNYHKEVLLTLKAILTKLKEDNFKALNDDDLYSKQEKYIKTRIKESFGKSEDELMVELILVLPHYIGNPYKEINFTEKEMGNLAIEVQYHYSILDEKQIKELKKTINLLIKRKTNKNIYFELDAFFEYINSYKDLLDVNIELSKYLHTPPKLAFNSYQIFEKALSVIIIGNFQCIKNIQEKLPRDAQFIVFTGENGDGKTSILQAIGLGLYNSNDLKDEDRGNKNTHIAIQYQEEDKYYTNDLYNNPELPTIYTLRHHMKELKNFAAYGTSRLHVSDTTEMQNPLLNLEPEKAKLTNIFKSWLRDISVNDEKFFEKIKFIILSILPNITEIKKKDESKKISDFLFIEKGVEVEFKHLSAGHKSIVLMIGDMIMRLAEAQPEEKNPNEFTGIVLIDEIEAHLHPKWQKEFPHILSTTFPKVQFIVTTHSAISLLGMPENTVFFRVQRSEEKGTYIERIDIDVKNLLPNAIYTSPLFDMKSIRSTENKGIAELNVEDNFEEIIKKEENKKRLKELSEKFVFTPPKS